MIIAEDLKLENMDYQEAFNGLAELKYISSVGHRIGLSNAEVTELALQAEYLNGLAMGDLDGFKKAWKKARKKTRKLRYKALKIIRKVAPILSMIPVIGLPFAIAHGLIEAQQIHQTKKKMKAALKKARKLFAVQMGKEEKDMNEEEKKASEMYAATQVKIAAAKGRWSEELVEEERAAQILLDKVRSEFGPQEKEFEEEQIEVEEDQIPVPTQFAPDILSPGVTTGTGTRLLTTTKTKAGPPIGLIIGGGLAVGGLLILMAKRKKKRR